MSSVLFLIATFVPLVLVEKWIHRHLHGVALLVSGHRQVALYVYALLLFPGVALHECSHWLAARLLGVKVGKLELLPQRDRRGQVRLGSLEVERVDAVRTSLIGVAPLLSGSLVVLAVGYLAFDVGQADYVFRSGDVLAIVEALFHSILRTPDMWLWLYVVFAFANAMLPSSADRQAWPPVILFLALLAGLGYLAGGQSLLSSLAPLVEAGLRWLATAFAITLVADVPFVVLIALAEWGVGELRGQRVDYR